MHKKRKKDIDLTNKSAKKSLRKVQNVYSYTLYSQNPLMKLVCKHEFAGNGAFAGKVARNAAGICSLRELTPKR